MLPKPTGALIRLWHVLPFACQKFTRFDGNLSSFLQKKLRPCVSTAAQTGAQGRICVLPGGVESGAFRNPAHAHPAQLCC